MGAKKRRGFFRSESGKSHGEKKRLRFFLDYDTLFDVNIICGCL